MTSPGVNHCEGCTLHTPPLDIGRCRTSAGRLIVKFLGCEGCEGCLVHLSREGAYTRTCTHDSSALTLHTLHRGATDAIDGRQRAGYGKVGVKGVPFTRLHAPSQEVST